VPLSRVADARRAYQAPEEDGLPVRALHAARALAPRFWRAAALAALASFLGACATPPIDRYLLQAEVDANDVRFKGSHGILSRSRSKAIFAQMKATSPGNDILERHVAIEQALTENPLSIGNKVVLLEDGAATYAAMLSAIRGAKHHVHLETYIFEADDTGKEFAAALVERAKAGVKVRLIYDAVGSFGTPKEFFADLAANGVEVVEFNPIAAETLMKDGLAGFNHRDHRKLTIVDGRVAFLGGINISDVYGSVYGSRRRARDQPLDQRPWRDTQAQIDGPAVADLQRSFLNQWARQKKELPIDDKAYYPTIAPQGSLVMRAIDGSPSDQLLNPMYVAFVSAVENAEKEVFIMNPYFVPHDELRSALGEAAKRGVDVKLILPAHSDSSLVLHAGQSYYDGLLEAGVKIYERKNRILHAKTACVDGVWSTVGSTNLDWRSLLYNDELNAVVLGPDFAAQMNAMFAKDLAESEEITLEKWRSRPLSERLKEIGARLWARFL
jgi:cardiolipin synthase A/B